MTRFWVAFAAIAVLFTACRGSEDAPVRATLSDGQVLYGSLRTATLKLEGSMGALEIPLSDVGEVVPVEGDEVSAADGHVKIWLRNGSELAGRWAEPELAMDIDVGGEEVRVDLPGGDLQRMQTQGGEIWPDAAVYRVRTAQGDDFLVDAAASQIVLQNDLGRFAPYLSECRSARPVGAPDGDWRVELETGTVLLGELVDDELTLALPLGPSEVTLPLASLVSMEQQDWYIAANHRDRKQSDRLVERQDEERRSSGRWAPWTRQQAEDFEVAADAAEFDVPVEQPAAAAPVTRSEWFERGALEATKQAVE